MLTIAGIYVLVNVALLYVLPISQIAGKEFAAGEAANAIFGTHGDTIFRCLTIASMLSGINALHLMATRVIFAMSRDGLFTSKAAVVNEGGTPTVSLFLSALVALLFIVFGQTFGRVITSAGVFLCRELHPLVHFTLRPATARTGQTAAISSLGLSGDTGDLR